MYLFRGHGIFRPPHQQGQQHQHQLKQLNATNWNSHRFLVMQCLDGMDDHCGGTADRLKPLVFLLREAHVTHRILLIYWTMPAKVEEFLVPPRGGLDWRAPIWFQPIVSSDLYIYIHYHVCLYYIWCRKHVTYNMYSLKRHPPSISLTSLTIRTMVFDPERSR